MSLILDPDKLAQFRRNSREQLYNWARKVCPGCKVTRSAGQFDGKEKCRKCRGKS